MKWAIALIVLAAMANCSFQLGCEVSVPEKVLSELHSGCDNDTKSRTGDCSAAMHRFCNHGTTPPVTLQEIKLGIPREHIAYRIGMSCVRADLSEDVNITELQTHHPGCSTPAKNQHRDCLSAIHRYCREKLDSTYAGMSQEVSGEVLRVLCFKSTKKESVHTDVLQQLAPKCTYPNQSDSDHCFAAANRWCNGFGFSGGITQETNTTYKTVACYNAEFSNDVFVERVSDFYAAQQRIDQICDVSFTISEGEVLNSKTETLEQKLYDNSASSVPLTSTFEVSKAITEMNRFTHEHLVSLGNTTRVSVYLPYYSAGIKLSPYPIPVDLMAENSKSTPYKYTSSASVPAGYAIVKKAKITKATLRVPWAGKVVNGLGAVKDISGKWIGVSTNYFRLVQMDVQQDKTLTWPLE